LRVDAWNFLNPADPPFVGSLDDGIKLAIHAFNVAARMAGSIAEGAYLSRALI
jgi:hypothetical protein